MTGLVGADRVALGEYPPAGRGRRGGAARPAGVLGLLEPPRGHRGGLLSGGWFRTGDIGRVDPDDCYLTITGRSKKIIISGGLNVYPREVERALEDHPAVDKAAVVGVPSDRWGRRSSRSSFQPAKVT